MADTVETKFKMAAEAEEEIPCVALGHDEEVKIIEFNDEAKPNSLEDRLTLLEEKQNSVINMLDNLFQVVKELRSAINRDSEKKLETIINTKKNSDKSIPEGTVLWGTSNGLSYFLHVKDGGFYVGNTKYDSLSAAAQAVSGVRRSGWAFWHLPNDKTVKEVYKN